MGQRFSSLRVLVLHNNDYRRLDPTGAHYASLADVEAAAQGVASALRSRGHAATILGVDGDTIPALLARLDSDRPDLVFNLCESLHGDSRHEVVVPSLLELAGVPYTGSGPLALGLALRKDRTKEILLARGIPTPPALTIRRSVAECDRLDAAALPFPLIVKPTREDASVGIESSSVVHDRAGLRRAVGRVLEKMEQPALVERFIEGRELYVSLLGNAPARAFPFHEIDFSSLPAGLPRIVSYAGKWDTASVEFDGTRPTRCILDDDTRVRAETAAQHAFEALGLADYGRVDVRLATDGTPYVIDVNPNCDLSAGAGYSRAAAYGGLDHAALIERVCLVALERRADEEHPLVARAEGEVVPFQLALPSVGFVTPRPRPSHRVRRAVPIALATATATATLEGLARSNRRRAP